MPPICWSLSGHAMLLRSATVKTKSIKAADLLQSWWPPGLSTMRHKSRRAAKLSMDTGAFCFSFLFGYGASDVRSRMGCQSHCAWSGWPSGKMPHRCASLYAGQRRGITIFISRAGFLEKKPGTLTPLCELSNHVLYCLRSSTSHSFI